MTIDYNEPVKFIGNENVNIDYHDGQLRPAVGVNSVQVLKANRENPEGQEAKKWTYNHAPMLAYHNGKYYLEYLSTPFEEHLPPGRSLLTISRDGMHWGEPRVIFPEYLIPDGVFHYEGKKLADGTYAVMHQRMGFYEAPNGKLLVLGNYGISPTTDQVPFANYSIGRVVREIYSDDSLGSIHFIRYNVNTVWNEDNTHYPLYTQSQDSQFIEACEALLSTPLVTQQWAEEQGDADKYITVKSQDGGAFYNKAFCWYKLEDGAVIGLWKWMKAAVSHDDGESWSAVANTPTIKHSGSKIWGQRTEDGNYALVYNPHTNNLLRWPLAVATSKNGLEYDKLMCVIGDLSPLRYAGGPFKDRGFNYVRGIENNGGKGADEALYVTYSVNKEDIWISRIPVPITDKVTQDVHDSFDDMLEHTWIKNWNIYSHEWASVKICKAPGVNGNCLKMEDYDRYDYAKAERVFREGKKVEVFFRLMAGQQVRGNLYIELCNAHGITPFSIIFSDQGELKVSHGRKFLPYMMYEAGKWYNFKLIVDTHNNCFDVEVDGKSLSQDQQYQRQSTSMKGWFFKADVKSVERIIFRTGEARKEPALWAEHQDLPFAGEKVQPSTYYIKQLDVISK